MSNRIVPSAYVLSPPSELNRRSVGRHIYDLKQLYHRAVTQNYLERSHLNPTIKMLRSEVAQYQTIFKGLPNEPFLTSGGGEFPLEIQTLILGHLTSKRDVQAILLTSRSAHRAMLFVLQKAWNTLTARLRNEYGDPIARNLIESVNLNPFDTSGVFLLERLTQLNQAIGGAPDRIYLTVDEQKAQDAGLPLVLRRIVSQPAAIGDRVDENRSLITQLIQDHSDKVNVINCNSLKLRAVPWEVFQFTQISILNLFENKLDFLSPAITHLTSLTRLHLEDNRLKNLPRSIKKLVNLQELYLGKNLLTIVPREMRALRNLRTLDLSDNEIERFPYSIVNLPVLGRLILSNNKLKELPSVIGNFKALLSLDLAGNLLTALPENEFVKLDRLMTLDLSDNRFSRSPGVLCKLQELYTLTLSGNPLQMTESEMASISSDVVKAAVEDAMDQRQAQ
jgi:hypothetical protein